MQTAVNLMAPIHPTIVNVRNYYRCSTLGCRSVPHGPSRCNKLKTPFDNLTDFDSFILNCGKHQNWSVGHFSDGSHEQCSLQHFGGNVQKGQCQRKENNTSSSQVTWVSTFNHKLTQSSRFCDSSLSSYNW